MSTAICSKHNNPLFVCQCHVPQNVYQPRDARKLEIVKSWDKALSITFEYQGKRYEGTVYEVWGKDE